MTPTMTVIEFMGMPLEKWNFESCEATVASGDEWATLYSVRSDDPSKGHATALLIAAKKHYENLGKRFGGSVALNPRMQAIYQRIGITEYGGTPMTHPPSGETAQPGTRCECHECTQARYRMSFQYQMDRAFNPITNVPISLQATPEKESAK